MNRRYYDEEMRYLHEAGKAFAEEHPDVARYLNIESLTDRDPYVERLFEGFAFLTGRIREQLDDELPQYTEGLLNLLAPQYLKPLPAFAIVQLEPKTGLVQEATTFARGTEVRSVPAGDEFTVCRFQTTQDVVLQPLHLREATLHWMPDQTSRVRLRFELERGASLEQLDLGRLRLYLHADLGTASALHLHLTRHIRRVAVGPGGAEPARMQGIGGQEKVQPVGFADDEALLPPDPRTFAGYRLLQEYLCFPRKFSFVDLLGLDAAGLAGELDAFDIDLELDRAFPEERRFGAEQIRLYCTPVVNLFETDAVPIRSEGLDAEHRVLPSTRHRKSIAVYDVQAVTGIEDATGRRHTYEPFYAFRHVGGLPAGRHYTASCQVRPGGKTDVYLMLGVPDEQAPGPNGRGELRPETVSVRLRATNGNLPHEKLQEGMISQLGPSVPQIVRPTNLTKPTRQLSPPMAEQRNFFWKLISHWSLNYLSVASHEALVGVLDLYDWTEDDARRRRNRRRAEGLEAVSWAPKEVLYRGGIVRGAEVTLRVREENFGGEGEVCLFGLVMSTFFSMYATINAFVHLTIHTLPSGKTFTWTPQRGDRPIL